MISLKNKTILITGSNGFLGSHLLKILKKEYKKKIKLITPNSKECDLTNPNSIKKIFLKNKKVDFVVHLASAHGGLYYNINNPASIYYKNILMNTHLMHLSMISGVKNMLCAGTVDSYPKKIPIPWKEKNYWDGFPEPTSSAYAFSKKMMVVQGEAYKKQYNFNTTHLLFMNLYGPRDNYNLRESHVIPAILQKIKLAKKKKKNFITLFGSGNQEREFLFIEDAAKAIILSLKNYKISDPINIGTGKTYKIKVVAEKILKILELKNFKIKWDQKKETGIKIKKFNINRAKKLIGYKPTTSLDEGLKKTIKWFLKK